MTTAPLPLFHVQAGALTLLVALALVGYAYLGRTPAGIFLYSNRLYNGIFAIGSVAMLVVDPAAAFSRVLGLGSFIAIASLLPWMFAFVGGVTGAFALVALLPTEWETKRALALLQYSLFTRDLPVDRNAINFDNYAAHVNLPAESRSFIIERAERATNDAGAPLFTVTKRDGSTWIALTAAGVAQEVSAERARATEQPKSSVEDILRKMARARRGLD